jgi:hypothetical protein
MRDSPLIWASSLLAVFSRIHSRKFLVLLTTDTYTGVLLQRSPGGTRTSTWAAVKVVPSGLPHRGPGTLPDGPADVRLGAASFVAAGTATVPVPLAMGLSVPVGLVA